LFLIVHEHNSIGKDVIYYRVNYSPFISKMFELHSPPLVC